MDFVVGFIIGTVLIGLIFIGILPILLSGDISRGRGE